jgi:hypothetical protein
MIPIEESFEGYIKSVYPNVTLPDWQKKDLARCFFSGAFAAFDDIIKSKSVDQTMGIYRSYKAILQGLTERN